MTHIHNELAQEIVSAIGETRFELKTYSSSKANAQANLNGRTHYVDDDTLKYFHSKIAYSNDYENGTIFALVESCAADMDNRNRGFRFVVFDLFGTVIERRKSSDLFSTKDKARKALNTFFEDFDALEHYKQAMAERAERLANDSKRLAAQVARMGGE